MPHISDAASGRQENEPADLGLSHRADYGSHLGSLEQVNWLAVVSSRVVGVRDGFPAANGTRLSKEGVGGVENRAPADGDRWLGHTTRHTCLRHVVSVVCRRSAGT